jgi:hypothetical protein
MDYKFDFSLNYYNAYVYNNNIFFHIKPVKIILHLEVCYYVYIILKSINIFLEHKHSIIYILI